MRSRRAAGVAVGLGLLGGSAAWTVGPALADAPASVAAAVPDAGATAATGASIDDILAGLVDAGTITQEQADAVVAALTPSAATTGETPPAPTDQPADPGAGAPAPGGDLAERSPIDDALALLVENGTLDQSQSDAVAASLDDAGFLFGPGGGGGPMGGFDVDLDTLADTLGLTADEVSAALAEGQSIADLAEAQGVDLQTVIDALVAAATERIDQEVADGRLTDDEAAEQVASLSERVTRLVDQPGGSGGMGQRRMPGNNGGPGGGGDMGPGMPQGPGSEQGQGRRSGTQGAPDAPPAATDSDDA